jgi:hypothetical protein
MYANGPLAPPGGPSCVWTPRRMGLGNTTETQRRYPRLKGQISVELE